MTARASEWCVQRPEKSDEELIVFIIFAFSILYRSLLLYRSVYPPGPDLGFIPSVYYVWFRRTPPSLSS